MTTDLLTALDDAVMAVLASAQNMAADLEQQTLALIVAEVAYINRLPAHQPLDFCELFDGGVYQQTSVNQVISLASNLGGGEAYKNQAATFERGAGVFHQLGAADAQDNWISNDVFPHVAGRTLTFELDDHAANSGLFGWGSATSNTAGDYITAESAAGELQDTLDGQRAHRIPVVDGKSRHWITMLNGGGYIHLVKIGATRPLLMFASLTGNVDKVIKYKPGTSAASDLYLNTCADNLDPFLADRSIFVLDGIAPVSGTTYATPADALYFFEFTVPATVTANAILGHVQVRGGFADAYLKGNANGLTWDLHIDFANGQKMSAVGATGGALRVQGSLYSASLHKTNGVWAQLSTNTTYLTVPSVFDTVAGCTVVGAVASLSVLPLYDPRYDQLDFAISAIPLPTYAGGDYGSNDWFASASADPTVQHQGNFADPATIYQLSQGMSGRMQANPTIWLTDEMVAADRDILWLVAGVKIKPLGEQSRFDPANHQQLLADDFECWADIRYSAWPRVTFSEINGGFKGLRQIGRASANGAFRGCHVQDFPIIEWFIAADGGGLLVKDATFSHGGVFVLNADGTIDRVNAGKFYLANDRTSPTKYMRNGMIGQGLGAYGLDFHSSSGGDVAHYDVEDFYSPFSPHYAREGEIMDVTLRRVVTKGMAWKNGTDYTLTDCRILSLIDLGKTDALMIERLTLIAYYNDGGRVIIKVRPDVPEAWQMDDGRYYTNSNKWGGGNGMPLYESFEDWQAATTLDEHSIVLPLAAWPAYQIVVPCDTPRIVTPFGQALSKQEAHIYVEAPSQPESVRIDLSGLALTAGQVLQARHIGNYENTDHAASANRVTFTYRSGVGADNGDGTITLPLSGRTMHEPEWVAAEGVSVDDCHQLWVSTGRDGVETHFGMWVLKSKGDLEWET